MTVDKPFKFNSFVQPACLPPSDHPYELGSKVTVSGFGSIHPVALEENLSKQLMAVELSLTYCKTKQSMVCAGDEAGKKDSCGGDSGGPLVQFDENDRATLVGIVSNGPDPCEGKAPGIYTKVSHFRKWIDNAKKSITYG